MAMTSPKRAIGEEAAYAREVAAGEVAVDTHGAERAGCYEECLCDCRQAVGVENGEEHHAVDYGEDVEKQRGHRCADAADGSGDGEDDAEFGDYQRQPHPTVPLHELQVFGGGAQKADYCGYDKAEGHLEVDPLHGAVHQRAHPCGVGGILLVLLRGIIVGIHIL